jgi:NAD(P)-dependent dehydrogenase (short-subunit alcohol dehydrogenase family)
MASDLFDLTGKTALITGGSRGLGKSMVLAFAAAGADVIVSSRKLDACEEVAADARDTTGRRAWAIACHVGKWEEIDRLVAEAYAAAGRIDVLINNAGMSPLYPSPADISEDLYDKVFDVNLKGPFRLAALVGTRMVADGGGTIVNISSIGSFKPDATIIPYGAAKAGLNAMTIGFADAFGPTVRVNCIAPGAFATDVTAAWDMDSYNQSAQRMPMKRIGQPEEIVGAALYFASAASSYTTGALLRVDGGA